MDPKNESEWDDEGPHIMIRLQTMGFRFNLYIGFTPPVWASICNTFRRIFRRKAKDDAAGITAAKVQTAGEPHLPVKAS
jgi:hypothetical protein